jgi:hypothetical protein
MSKPALTKPSTKTKLPKMRVFKLIRQSKSSIEPF